MQLVRPRDARPPRDQPGRSWLREALRHWPLLLVLVGGVALRAAAWYAIHPAWWFIGDSIDYVRDAILRLPNTWRPSGYSFLLLMPLRELHSLALITAVQHLLGLATAVIVYALLVRYGLPPWAAALAAAPALLDAYIVATEQLLLAEALFTALVMGAVALLLWGRSRPQPVVCLLAGGMLGLAVTTRAIGAVLLPVFAVVLLRRLGAVRVAALALAFSLPVAAYVFEFDRIYHRPNLTLSSGVFLYGRVSQFVDCSRVAFPDPDLRRLCPSAGPGRDELFYVFDDRSPLRAIGDPGATDDAARSFAVAAIRSQPEKYVALVGQDLVHSFGLRTEGWVVTNYQFGGGRPMTEEARQVGQRYEHADPGPFYRPALVQALAAYQHYAWVPGLGCLLALLAAAVGFVFGRDPERRGLRTALALAAGSALALLVLPPFTVLPDPRYRLPAIPLLCLAVPLGLRLLANRAARPRAIAEQEPALERKRATRPP
jgi:hypothetical protein